MNTIRHIIRSAGQAFAAVLVASLTFVAAEPGVTAATVTATDQFTISQQVTTEISFATLAANVSMSPSLGGLTGGSATGTTQVAVRTNSSTGYTMNIQASSSVGMLGNANPANDIPAYLPTTPSVPDYTFAVNSPNSAAFGYTVGASTTSDVDQKFLNNGTACNTGATGNTASASLHCWLNASTTAVQIINRTTPTPSTGATTTLTFHVVINANPSPVIPNDTYVATTTLTATAN